MDAITKFRGEFDFLSNFYPCKITYSDFTFSSVEAAFQSVKCVDPAERAKFQSCSVLEAKKLGRRVALRGDWESIKIDVMRDLLEQKFSSNKKIKQKLLDTKSCLLVEENTWHDNYWGNCVCDKCKNIEGANILGILLMSLREKFAQEGATK